MLKSIVLVALLWLPACTNTSTRQGGENASVSLQLFYDQLSPYGMWINYPPYGYVWVPSVGWGFAPYVTSGTWVYTSYGWTWHSYYPWGWASFHYGRWFYDGMFGWVWVPDTVWAPAWVAWSYGGGYCGWAPLGPRASVTVVVRGAYTIPHDHWVFVRGRDLANRRIDRYRITRSRNREILQTAQLVRDTREHHNILYMPGPDRSLIKSEGNKSIDAVAIREKKNPGSSRMTKDGLEIFKPNTLRENTNTRKSTPDKVFQRREAERQFQEQKQYPRRREFQEYRERPSVRQNFPMRGIDQRGNGRGRKDKG